MKVYEYVVGLSHYAAQEEVERPVIRMGFEYKPGVFIEVAGVDIYSNGCAPPDLVDEDLKHEGSIVVGIFGIVAYDYFVGGVDHEARISRRMG